MNDSHFYTKRAEENLKDAEHRSMELPSEIYDQLAPILDSYSQAIQNLIYAIGEVNGDDS